VEQLAQETRAASEQAKSDELKKLAEELQRSAERLAPRRNPKKRRRQRCASFLRSKK
jgi:hypothetical protein